MFSFSGYNRRRTKHFKSRM